MPGISEMKNRGMDFLNPDTQEMRKARNYSPYLANSPEFAAIN